MIEKDLRRMFPGVAFHHISPDKLEGRDLKTQSAAKLHNVAEENYASSKTENVWQRVIYTNRDLPRALRTTHIKTHTR